MLACRTISLPSSLSLLTSITPLLSPMSFVASSGFFVTSSTTCQSSIFVLPPSSPLFSSSPKLSALASISIEEGTTASENGKPGSLGFFLSPKSSASSFAPALLSFLSFGEAVPSFSLSLLSSLFAFSRSAAAFTSAATASATLERTDPTFSKPCACALALAERMRDAASDEASSTLLALFSISDVAVARVISTASAKLSATEEKDCATSRHDAADAMNSSSAGGAEGM
mmetsp:Transcript_4096/g.8677  ORF Transcript_4096/g.8677 Transcript_4096/m.8677 type:complete len:229 (-) Transcript_4096:1641-2327(-)